MTPPAKPRAAKLTADEATIAKAVNHVLDERERKFQEEAEQRWKTLQANRAELPKPDNSDVWYYLAMAGLFFLCALVAASKKGPR
jgi:hypothetical protein